jgi:ABC-2 type transport system permease protein
MAVHERLWRPWEGKPVSTAKRLLVVPRHAWREVFRSRIFTGIYAACFLLPAIAAVVIYLRHNLAVLEEIGIRADRLFVVDETFFLFFLTFQCFFGFVVVLVTGPALLSPDLVNGALPLFLSRPFTRTEYLAGKLLVLGVMLSGISWVPALLLFALQGGLEGNGWALEHWRIVSGAFVGSWAFILTISFYSFALSAWVRSRALARAALVGTVFVASGLGGAMNGILDTRWGALLMPIEVIQSIWIRLLQADSEPRLPAWAAASVLVVVSAFSLALVARRLRALEVVR